MENHWSNSCANILNKCNKDRCQCYIDYYIWSKDEPKLDFEQWRELILLERTDLNVS